jgi:RHS repeat-associated protein
MDIEKTLYLGSYERETHGRIPAGGGTAVFDKTVHRHSIGAFAVYTRTEDSAGTATRLSTIIKDHLGSTNAIVTATWNGSSFVPTDTERQSFDSWGERRDAETLVRFRIADTDPFRRSAKDHDRGYTGHEQLDDSGLIHMNGRIYDPELGRMLSPDPFVQIPEYSQNFNRYSYVLNNPLNKTDPSGYSWLSKAFDKVGDWFSENWRTVASIVVTGVLTVLTAGVATAAAVAVYGATSSIGLASAAAYAAWGATVGTLSGGFNAAIGGGDLGDVLRGSLVGGVTGALTGGLHMVGGNAGLAALNVVGHGVVGGASNVAMGGKFQDGFLSAAASASTAVTGLTSPESSPFNKAGRTIIASAAGGTASVIGGGKFANGAYTGAFAHLLNAEGGSTYDVVKKRYQDWLAGNLPQTEYFYDGSVWSEGMKNSAGGEAIREYFYRRAGSDGKIDDFAWSWTKPLTGTLRMRDTGFNLVGQFIGSYDNGMVLRVHNTLFFVIHNATSNESYSRFGTFFGLPSTPNLNYGPRATSHMYITWNEPYDPNYLTNRIKSSNARFLEKGGSATFFMH